MNKIDPLHSEVVNTGNLVHVFHCCTKLRREQPDVLRDLIQACEKHPKPHAFSGNSAHVLRTMNLLLSGNGIHRDVLKAVGDSAHIDEETEEILLRIPVGDDSPYFFVFEELLRGEWHHGQR